MIPEQLNGTYFAEEDRVMLKIRTKDDAEYRLWLTRHITQKVLAVIEKISIKSIEAKTKNKALSKNVMETMDEMQQKNVERQTDLTQKYKSTANLPLGAAPVLITSATFTIFQNSKVTMKCILKLRDPIDFEFNMATLARVRVLLTRLCEKANWNLSAVPEKNNDEAKPSRTLH
jgi:hypothetical protein